MRPWAEAVANIEVFPPKGIGHDVRAEDDEKSQGAAPKMMRTSATTGAEMMRKDHQ
jgi:hypothetical protein